MSDFKTVLIKDARIADITNEEIFGVQASAAQSTYQQFQSISASNSSINFNVQIPSENIAIDRHLLLRSTVTMTLSLGNVPAGESAFDWGLTEGFQAFPLQSLFSTVQTTINNVSTSTNLQDIKDMILSLNDKRKLCRYNSLTPSLRDEKFGMYADAVGTNCNVLASMNNSSYDGDFNPRGAFRSDNAADINKVLIYHYVAKPQDALPTNSSTISTGLTDTWYVVIQYTFVEPFIALSPFVNTEPNNSAALIGINNMTMVLNVDSTLKRFLSTAKSTYIGDVLRPKYITNQVLGVPISLPIVDITAAIQAQAVGFTNTSLLFNFLSLQPEDYARINTKNVVPYLDYPRFLTTSVNNASIASGASLSITTQNLQLNQVSDLIVVVVRVPMSAQTIACSASFLTIEGVQINFNNSSGLLATATKQDLYNLSYRNGSSQSYNEFSGTVNKYVAGTGNCSAVPSIGSVLVLNPVYDFSLPSYLSSSSLGQYNLQMNITVKNQFPYAITPEVVIMTVNSGVFVTQQGSSSIFTGILTKEVVLKTKEENPVPQLSSVEYKRLVGGKLSNMGMSNVRNMVRRKGGASSGGASSGGASSGGRSRLSKHLL